jgi:hypothetical protein
MSESVSQAPARSGNKIGKLFRKQEGQGMVHADSALFVRRKSSFFSGVQTHTEDTMDADHADVQAFFIPAIQRKTDQPIRRQPEEVQEKPSADLFSSLRPNAKVQLLCADCEQEKKLQRVSEEAGPVQREPEEIQEMPQVQSCEACEKEEMTGEKSAGEEKLQRAEKENATPAKVHPAQAPHQVQASCSECGHESVKQKPKPASLTVVQPSLKVGAPNDAYEQEADQMADKVMRMLEPVFSGGEGIRPGNSNNNIQRKEEEPDEVQASPEQPSLQRLPGGGMQTSPGFSTRLQSGLHGGDSLSAPVRTGMESAFHADFTGVRIHTGSHAASLSSEIGAQAFTYQNNIFFNENKYNPDSSGGRSLLAHELTHTVQQGASKTVHRDPEPSEPPSEEESYLDKLKNAFDSTLQLLLPTVIYNFYRKIKNGGILNFIKETLLDLFKGLFGKLGFSETEIVLIFQIFATLKDQLPAIIEGLSNNDCKPLFAALNLLSDVMGAIAGRIWDNLMAKIEPIRLWLIDVWQTFGAPVIDAIKTFAGEQWEQLKALGRFIWDNFYAPIIAKGKMVWDWVVKKLGFGSDDEPGLMSWISNKLSEVWQDIKKELKPVIDPINDVIEGIKAIASMDAVKKMQEDAKKWLDEVVKTATAMGSDEDAVANKQLTLRQVLLPALNKAIDRLKAALRSAGEWVVEKVHKITDNISGFINGIQANSFFSPLFSLVKWIPKTAADLNDWATDKVNGLFDRIVEGVDHLRKFIDPVLTLLEKLVTVVGNLLKYLPDLILGVPFMFLPRCIKDPIIKWLTEVVLKQIPIIGDFIVLTEKWDQIKTAALTVLKQVFIDGQLAKGLWTFFKTLLDILGIDPMLVTKVVAKAAQNFSDIISKPGAFFKNVWGVIKGGFNLFWDHILTHLPKGALDWLFGEVKGATGVPTPKDFSVGSIFGFVLELFGITLANIYDRMSKNPRIGPKKVAIIKNIEKVVRGALEWISVWINEGPDGLLKKIKQKIGDLKNMVIQGVVSWITTKVTEEILKKLATSSDPLGIGATINTIITIYKAIKTAIAYVNRMLDLVNQAMDDLAKIIAGDIDEAAVGFEKILAKAVPIVIGFAVEAIIGPVGVKIKEVVDGVRKKIDEGIDWLINSALDMIEGLIETAKGLIEDIKGLLGIEKKFNAKDGEEHRLYFTGDEANPELTVASTTPKTFKAFIQSLTTEDAEMQKNKTESEKLAGDVDSKRGKVFSLYKQAKDKRQKNEDTTDLEKQIEDEKDAVKKLLDQISEKIAPLFSPDQPTGSYNDPIPMTWYKSPSDYESQIQLEGIEGMETIRFSRTRTFVFPKEDYQVKYTFLDPDREDKDKKEERKAKNRLSVVEKTSVDLGGSENYLPQKDNKSNPLKKVGSYRGVFRSGPQRAFRKILEDHGYDLSGKDADHVLDLQFAGPDDFSNMWPLEESVNRSALSFSNQGIVYKDAAGKIRTVPLGSDELSGKYFYVKDYQRF